MFKLTFAILFYSIYLKSQIYFLLLYIELFSKSHTLNGKKTLKKETHCNFLLKKETFQIKRDLKETQKVV